MSGITLKQILMAINRFEEVMIEGEFGEKLGTGIPGLWLQLLSEEQLQTKWDYMRTIDGHITIGLNDDELIHFEELINRKHQ